MATVARCLSEIQSVRDVAQGAEAAYVARSRVGRLGLTVARLASQMVGGAPPERPVQLPVPSEADVMVRQVLRVGNAIQGISEFIRQPSEPLDARWAAMWDELEGHLDSLEAALLELDDKGINGGQAAARRHQSLR